MDYMKEFKDISAEEAVILWQASRLSLSKSYEKAPEILKVHGSVIGTLGNFSASIGKAKSKKTFNVSAIVAAALKNGTVLRYMAELSDGKRKVLYVDTEQSPYHCLKVMKRILRMAGLPDDRDNENLEFLALRKYTPEQRIKIVEQAIYNTPGIGLVIIDGIRDMVYDINSPGESTRIISKLMQWTDDRQIHIHTILHQAYHRAAAPYRIGSRFRAKRGIRLQGTGRCFNQKLYVNRGKTEPSKGGTAHHHASQQTDDSARERQKIHIHARLPLLAYCL